MNAFHLLVFLASNNASIHMKEDEYIVQAGSFYAKFKVPHAEQPISDTDLVAKYWSPACEAIQAQLRKK